MDPVLVPLDQLLEDDALFQRVTADLGRRAPHTATRGRSSTPVEVILRMVVVKRLYHWRDAVLNDHVVARARALQVTRGRQRRIDRRVVETTIHHPTHSRLLGDGVHVLSRWWRLAHYDYALASGVDRVRELVRVDVNR